MRPGTLSILWQGGHGYEGKKEVIEKSSVRCVRNKKMRGEETLDKRTGNRVNFFFYKKNKINIKIKTY